MSTLPSTVNPDTWKVKCAHLIREFDGKQKTWELNEKFLCRVIIRLTIATKGLDKSLDPHLNSLNGLLKSGSINTRTRQQADHISKDLVYESKQEEPEAKPNIDAELLFRFIRYCAIGAEEKNQLENIQEQFSRGDIADVTALFATIEDIFFQTSVLHPDQKSGILSKLLKSKQKKSSSAGDDTDHNIICGRLIRLINELEVPSEFRESLDNLKNQLVSNLSGEILETWLDDLIELLGETKSTVEDEQKEIEGFFAQLTSKLQDLEQQTLGTGTSLDQNHKDRDAFDCKMSEQVQALKSDTVNANSLQDIKQSLSNRLDNLTEQLTVQREEDQHQSDETEKQFSQMANRLQDLEMESQELRTRLRVTYNQALRDPLTSLPNRLAYNERMAQEYARWQRFGNPLTMLVWDIDYFKTINDRFGHLAGDKALKAVASVLEEGLRKTDFIARFGGEEFVSLLVGTEADAALFVANRIREKVAQSGFNSKGKPISVTISCGICQFEEPETPETVFSRADKALYQAKEQGRNRCIIN